MSTSFVIEGWRLRAGDGTVRLFKCDSSSARVEIHRHIILGSDDMDESKKFTWRVWNAADRLYAHMIDQLLPVLNNQEPSAVRDATVEYVSKVLAVDSRSEFHNIELKGETITLTAESILERLKTQEHENRSHFRVYSGLECRLPSMTSSMREEIKQKTISYLEELRFSPSVIKSVQNELDQIVTAL